MFAGITDMQSCRRSEVECVYGAKICVLTICQDAVPQETVPYSNMMRDHYKRIEGLEKKVTEQSALAETESESSHHTGSIMDISQESPRLMPDFNSLLSPTTRSVYGKDSVTEDRQKILDVFFSEVDNRPGSG